MIAGTAGLVAGAISMATMALVGIAFDVAV